MASVNDLQTLPGWVREWGERFSLDAVRKAVRTQPALRALGTKFGAVRLYRTDEAEVIREAVERRNAARRTAPVPAAV